MSDLKTPRSYEDFDPECYIKEYVIMDQGNTEKNEYLQFILDSLHDMFSTGTISGDKLLDVGSGPSVRAVVSASRHVNEIHLSDLAPQNRAMLQKWLDGMPCVLELFEYITEKENEGVSPQSRAQDVREKVTKLYPIDLQQPNIINNHDCTYDVIAASLCMEMASRTKEEYYSIVRKIADKTNPGGYVVLVGVMLESFYQVGEYKFKTLSISGDEVRDAFTKAGFDIKDWKELPNKRYKEMVEKEFSDFGSMVIMAAQKNPVETLFWNE